MAKIRPVKRNLDSYTISDTNTVVKRNLDSYTIRGTNTVVKPGDNVLLRSPESNTTPYVAKIKKIQIDNGNDVTVQVRWYYRPGDSIGGRKQFHGEKELFLSDHYDIQSAYTIQGKCMVHSLKNYTQLENAGAEDYYCRFEYKAANGLVLPSRVVVYCKCKLPENPDLLMVQCEECKNWYHPFCVDMTNDQAKHLHLFICSNCNGAEDKLKRPMK
ncbi:chromatin remodeling protein EBS-like [Impatiens glandulifera]|uniref:chromatin remodeling protein EBS-like n=1 Tax=Impatiens glandulifera TaxID=253017 RepID=UPI001FB05BB5|nr:chromatin remodeling protein EBS-like [Impatiens glandulifera]